MIADCAGLKLKDIRFQACAVRICDAAFTMLSNDGRTCFHSRVFRPQSGLQQSHAQNLHWMSLAMTMDKPVDFAEFQLWRKCSLKAKRIIASAHLTQILSVLPFRMLLSRKDLIFSAMKSTLQKLKRSRDCCKVKPAGNVRTWISPRKGKDGLLISDLHKQSEEFVRELSVST